MSDFQARYALYAKAHGLTPDEALERDAKARPAGKMTGYILWISARWNEWRELRGVDRFDPITPEQHADFDAWLASVVETTRAAEVSK